MISAFNKNNGEIINDAKVTLGRKNMPYEPNLLTYILYKNKKGGLLAVGTKKETAYFNIEYYSNRDYNRYGSRFIWRRCFWKIQDAFNYSQKKKNKRHEELSMGYVAFSKPKYLPNDTLKLKAFVVSENGKPYKKDVILEISKEYSDDVIIKKMITPISDGVFLYNMPFADTIKLNRYNVSLYDLKEEQLLLSNDFVIEDYQLDEAKYDIRSSKEIYNKGDKVSIYLSGKNANDMNLMGSRVSLELRTKYVNEYLKESLFIPNIVWECDTTLDAIGETKIIIPESVFPAIEANYSLYAVFNNSNNETHNDRIYFNYLANNNCIKTRLHNDSIYADFYENGHKVNANGKLETYEEEIKRITKSEIYFPFKAKIDTRYTGYTFNKGSIYSELGFYDRSSMLECVYDRTDDSVFIKFINPHKIPFKYTIYKNNNSIIEAANVIELNKAFKSKTKGPYIISYQYRWGGDYKREEHVIRNFENNLNVYLVQPSKILPGQEVDVKVKITDFNNNAVENANVLASSVNSMFEDSSIPEVSSWNKYYKPRKSYPNSRNSLPKKKISNQIHKRLYSTSNIDTIDFYNFIFPENGLKLHYDSSHNISNAQFMPHIYDGGLPMEIHIIYVDDRVLYYSGSHGNKPNSIILPEGKHNIKLRTYNREYIINDVELINGSKLDVALDIGNLPEEVIVVDKSDILDTKEKLVLSYSLLVFDYIYSSNDIYFWQGDVNIKYTYRYKDNKTILGPFKQGVMINYAIRDGGKGSFIFMSNSIYEVNDDDVKRKAYYFTNEEITLNKSNFDLPIGLVKTNKKKILKSPINKYAHLTTQSNLRSTLRDEGLYKIDYVGDSIFELIAIKKQDTGSYFLFFPGMQRIIHGLTPGMYDIIFVTNNGSYFTKDSVSIFKNGVNYNKFGDNELLLIDSITFKDESILGLEKLILGRSTTYFNKDSEGALYGRVMDSKTNEPLAFVNVAIYRHGKVIGGGYTDFDGKYKVKHIPAGIYDVRVTNLGYSTTVTKGVTINREKIRSLNIKLVSSSDEIDGVTISCYRVPLIDKDAVSDGRKSKIGTYTTELTKMSGCSAESVAISVGGVFSTAERLQPQAKSIVYDDEVDEQENISVQANSTRTNFKDYAYWQPYLITNSEGEVEFTAKFPDDITKWKNYAIAMSFNKQSGIGVSETKAVKMLMAELSTPRFLIEGDETNVIGKISNYLDEGQLIKSKFTLDDNILSNYDTTVTTSLIKSQQVSAKGIDTLNITYSFKRKEGYSDGELRKIPVFAKGMEETQGNFYALDKDTTIDIVVDKNSKVELSAQSSIIETLYDDIKDVQNYKYMCMEQTASKLTAYLLEEQICEALGQKFTNGREIKKLIKRLEKGQNDDGSWGWWPQSSTNMWMTAYVSKALYFASQNDYEVHGLLDAVEIMKWKLDLLENNELLYVLSVFTDMEVELNYVKYRARIDFDDPTEYQKLAKLNIEQYIKSSISIQTLLSDAKHTAMGNVYWGESNTNWYNNANNTTLLAYNIIMKSDSQHPYLPLIRNYFIESKASNKWSNTVDKSQVLATILPAIIKESDSEGKIISPKLSISGDYTAEVKQFPYTTTLPQGVENLQITKSGTGPIYFSSFTKKWNANPEVKNETFEIDTWFELDGKPIDTLISGKVVELKVRIKVKKMANYVMIEIPIPAGCSYDDNRRREAYWEVHRQYYKNKTSIFSEQLNVGEYTISIKLQPRFSGAYTLNPAKAELMYFPVFYGNNGLKTTVIE